MRQDTKTRAQLAAIVFSMTNAVLFGAGLITVLTVPALSENAAWWIPAAVLASFVVAAPIAWFIAPRLRARYWRARDAQHPPVIVLPPRYSP
jgi:hypothetical protein